MTRRSTPVDPSKGHLAAFAQDLRALRDKAGSDALTVASRQGVPRSTVYALLQGARLPSREMLARLVRAWGGDEAEWMLRRSAVEQELAAQREQHQRADVGTVIASSQSPEVIPRQLPHAVPHFVGRTKARAWLTDLMVRAGSGIAKTMVATITGPAGIGKTAFAIYWAHERLQHFPDGQLYFNLRGFDPVAQPVPPQEIIRAFLEAFAIPAERTPNSFEAQVGLFRSLLSGRRVLLILDNARDSEQVRPLIPGDSGCAVIITSRNQLTGLVVREGVSPLRLDLLSTPEARELLVRLLGRDRVTAEPGAIDSIIQLSENLPLALSIVAGCATAYPLRPLSALVNELRAAQNPLDILDAGETFSNLRAVFSWSYQSLTASAAQTFRLLGLHAGPDISLPAAVSLVGNSVNDVQGALHELVRVNLLSIDMPDRFVMHDLLRLYAAELAHTHDSDVERREAIRRLLDHYLYMTNAATQLLEPHKPPFVLPPPEEQIALSNLADHEHALTWLATEYSALLSAIAQADKYEFHTHVWQISLMLASFMDRRGLWHDYESTHSMALEAARRIGDLDAEARIHRGLGGASLLVGYFDKARTHLLHALEHYRHVGDSMGEADVILTLAGVATRLGNYNEALVQIQHALTTFTNSDYILGQAEALNSIGSIYFQLGEYEQALAYCRQALTLHEKLGDQLGKAMTLGNIGDIYNGQTMNLQAIAYYKESLVLFKTLGDLRGEAEILTRLGDLYRVTGDSDAARDAWRQALAVEIRLDQQHVDSIRSKLQALDNDARTSSVAHSVIEDS